MSNPVVVAYYSESGHPRGGGMYESAQKKCGLGSLGIVNHCFALMRGERGDGQVCECGQFVLRVGQCPTCGHHGTRAERHV